MKREKRTTKKERKGALAASGAAVRRAPQRAPQQGHDPTHIHCIACGKHLEPSLFGEPGGASFYRCQHGGDFPHCAACAEQAKQLVDEHDRTNQPVRKAAARH